MILVTGAAGFIGYQTVKKLETLLGANQVISVDDLAAFDSRPEHTQGLLKAEYLNRVAPEAILTDSFFESYKTKGMPIAGIIHLGACTDTTEMRVDYLTRVNLNYSQTLWKLATQFAIPFVYASSAATYGAGECGYTDQETEMTKLKPLNPYGESKRLFDLWLMEQKVTPPAWSGFKFFNVYGFGERHKIKMASVVLQGFDQINASGKLKLFKSHKAGVADGEQKRDFIYVEDVVDVLLFALGVGNKPGLKHGIYNLGSGQARSFKDLALATFKALGKEPHIEFIDTPIEIRDRYQYFTEANMQKLKEQGFLKPFTSLEEGVKKTVAALEDFAKLKK